MSELAPETIAGGAEIWQPNSGQDPSRYLVNPGHWNPASKSMTPGQLVHARPWLDSGRRIFIWPTPTEGFSRQGTNTLALHHYIGDENVDVQIIHRGEKRIEMSGVFPGISGQPAMVEMENTLNDDPPDSGMTLHVPGVFEQVKFVVPESWEFTHDADDQTHSISYRVTFVVMGEGKRVPDPGGSPPPTNPGTGGAPGENQSSMDQVGGGDANNNQPGGGGGGGSGGNYSYDINDWIYGATIPAGYTADQLYQWAKSHAPTISGQLMVPMHIMNQGMVQNGKFSVKFTDPNGIVPNDTEWIDLPPPGSAPDPTPAPPPSNPPPSTGGGGIGGIFTSSGVRTLRAVSNAVYGTPDRWSDIYAFNEGYLSSIFYGVPTFLWASYDMPVGIHLSYPT